MPKIDIVTYSDLHAGTAPEGFECFAPKCGRPIEEGTPMLWEAGAGDLPVHADCALDFLAFINAPLN